MHGVAMRRGKGKKRRAARRGKGSKAPPTAAFTVAPQERLGRPTTGTDTHYANGRRRPVTFEPTEAMIAERRGRLGGKDGPLSAAEMRAAITPLTCLGAMGRLTPDEVAAGLRYAELYRQAGIALPTVQVADPLRVRGQDNSDGCPVATATLRRIWEGLRPNPGALIALSSVCLLDEWPRAGRAMHDLAAGLATVREFMKAPRTRNRPRAANDDKPVLVIRDERPAPVGRIVPGPIATEETTYITPEGETLFEAVRRRRRRA